MKKMTPLTLGSKGTAAVLSSMTGKKVDPAIAKASSLRFLQTALHKTPAQAAKLLGT